MSIFLRGRCCHLQTLHGLYRKGSTEFPHNPIGRPYAAYSSDVIINRAYSRVADAANRKVLTPQDCYCPRMAEEINLTAIPGEQNQNDPMFDVPTPAARPLRYTRNRFPAGIYHTLFEPPRQ